MSEGNFEERKDWRDRAETILLLAAGESVEAVAERQGLCSEAVRIRRRKWLKSGLASLLGPAAARRAS